MVRVTACHPFPTARLSTGSAPGRRGPSPARMSSSSAIGCWPSGRKRGGRPGTGLSARSARLTLGRLSAAFEMACEDNRLQANPCRYVRLPAQGRREWTTWDETQLRRWLAAASADRLAACWLLSALGLRRGEVLGLRWSDVSFDADTLTIARSRVLVNARVLEKSPKSRRSARVLPMPPDVRAALAALQALQLEEQLGADSAYTPTGYVAADPLGAPLYPERLTDEFARLCRDAGVPVIRLHDTRATVNSLLERAGVSDSVRAAWLGHSIAVNRSAYLAPAADLAAASDTIGTLLRRV
jgi:integrase